MAGRRGGIASEGLSRMVLVSDARRNPKVPPARWTGKRVTSCSGTFRCFSYLPSSENFFLGSFGRLETVPHRAPLERGLRTPNSPLSFLVLFVPVVAVKLHTKTRGLFVPLKTSVQS